METAEYCGVGGCERHVRSRAGVVGVVYLRVLVLWVESYLFPEVGEDVVDFLREDRLGWWGGMYEAPPW